MGPDVARVAILREPLRGREPEAVSRTSTCTSPDGPRARRRGAAAGAEAGGCGRRRAGAGASASALRPRLGFGAGSSSSSGAARFGDAARALGGARGLGAAFGFGFAAGFAGLALAPGGSRCFCAELEVVGGARVRVLEDVVGLVDTLRRLEARRCRTCPDESCAAYLASSSEWSWRPRHRGAGTRRSASWRARSRIMYGSSLKIVSVRAFRLCPRAWARWLVWARLSGLGAL